MWEQAGDPPHSQSLSLPLANIAHCLLVRVQPCKVVSYTLSHFQLDEVKVLTPFYR